MIRFLATSTTEQQAVKKSREIFDDILLEKENACMEDELRINIIGMLKNLGMSLETTESVMTILKTKE